MALTIEIYLEPGEFNPGVRSVLVDVRDPDNFEVRARFTYTLIFHRPVDGGAVPGGPVDVDGPVSVSMYGVQVSRPGTLYPMFGWEDLSISKVRDLPLHTWESAAREYLIGAIPTDHFRAEIQQPRGQRVQGPPSYLTDPAMQDAAARNLLRGMFPDLVEGDTPASRRKFQSHLKLAHVAVEYMRHLMEGRSDPAAEIARTHGVNPGTARTWIHRARQARFLGASVGRTAGQRKAEHVGLKEEER